ncbi:MAG TPA: class III poly(R)-hydroxyalkanoic acid synthase subunit PhaE [Nitrospira sp.]|jgi:class III poly(R)-hydroxyalkanoic acid synthase PhaE subunit|nr:class III poly(R)-hydroxyalkanoic acid synthase subunit PhaE [Nitrospira sp.]
MFWNDQAEAVTNAFTESQTKIWESWCALFRTVPSPMMPLCFGMDQWRELTSKGLQDWTAESEQVVKDVAQRLHVAQDTAMRFLELSLSAWKAMTPKVESGEDWQTMFANYSTKLREQLLLSPDGMARTAGDMAELWRLYLEEWQKLSQPWTESWRRASWHFGQAATGDGSALIKLTNLYWDAYERTFGRLMESPSLGHTRELNEQLLKGFDSWLDFRRASFEYQVVMSETWCRSFERFIGRMASLVEAGKPVQDVRQLLFLWLDVVDENFLAVFRSDEYIRMQGHLMNTAMTYRIHERDIVEAFLKISHVPSRSELDEAYRRIYELRKEVKELKSAFRQIQSKVA